MPGASSVTRCLGLIDTLVSHGGGDRATSLKEVQFLLFKLDAGSSVVVDAIADPLVRHILASLFREMGLRVRADPESGEQGWMTPVDEQGRVAYKMLQLLAGAFKKEEEADQSAAGIVGPIGPTAPPAAATSTELAAPRVLGPAMPRPEDFDRLAAGDGDAPVNPDDADNDDDGGNFGPKMPSQMTPQEVSNERDTKEHAWVAQLACKVLQVACDVQVLTRGLRLSDLFVCVFCQVLAFARLRESREQLSALKAAASESRGQPGGREEWMTALPAGDSSLPSGAALAALMASGDVESMRGRGFQSRTAAVRHEQDIDWTMSPAEKERKNQERLAIKQAEQAVYNVSRLSRQRGRATRTECCVRRRGREGASRRKPLTSLLSLPLSIFSRLCPSLFLLATFLARLTRVRTRVPPPLRRRMIA